MNTVLKIFAVSLMLSAVACSSTSESTPLPDGVDPTDTQLEATKTPKDSAASTSNVFYFDFDSDIIRAEDRAILTAYAARLTKDASKSIRLEGHASEEGTREYNLALGERRAKAVEMFLLVNGVAASQIDTVSYGEEQPAESGSTSAALAKNRRVEIK
jgi:peptidoglycan-associated lipoprotein